jgi:hypothetical protein
MFNPQAKTRPTSGANIDHALVQQDHRDLLHEEIEETTRSKRQAEAAAIAENSTRENLQPQMQRWKNGQELMDEEVSKPSEKMGRGEGQEDGGGPHDIWKN